MTTSTNIKINIVEPGSPTPAPAPVDPSTTGTTDIAVPDTGLFTHGIGTLEATIIAVSVVLILAIAAIISLCHKKKSNKKTESATEAANKPLLSKITKFTTFGKCMKSNKKISIPLATLALVISLSTLAALLVNAGKGNTNAIEPTEGNKESTSSLTLDVESEELTIEVADEPVFAYLPVKLTVEEATQAGYTLTTYTDSTDIVSTTNPDNKIPMVAINEEDLSEYTYLTDNTWGLSLEQPQDQNSEVYTTLSTDQSNPTILKTIDDYSETEANDKTTIYYGFYITPDMPYGTYEGSEINYTATANRTDLAKVTFDGNGLTFNSGKTTNVVRYEKAATDKTELYSHTPNVNDAGEYTEYYPISSNRTFVYNFANAVSVTIDVLKTGNDSCCGPDGNDYFSFWSGSHPEYTALADWDKGVKLSGSDGKYVFGHSYDGSKTYSATVDSDSLTVAYATSDRRGTSTGTDYGLGYYARITATDADGNPAYAVDNVPFSGEYETPATTEYENYEFLGWSSDPNATSASFEDAADIETYMLLSAGEKVTLYAVWSPIVNISYDGNNATVGSMESTYNNETVVLGYQNVIAGNNIDLYAPNYKKDGYGFAGWSTDQDAWDNLTDDDETDNPTIYGPNQSFTMTKDMALGIENGDMTLYAVWALAEQNNGTPVALQDWQGCSNLTATTYDTETGALSVGKNTITALTDNRDGNIYTVARLADGNCWMTENLRLDNEATISTTNTNNPLTVDNNVAIKNNDGNTSAHLSPNSNSWCTKADTQCYNQSYLNINNTNFTDGNLVASYNNSGNNLQWYSYGSYYNWYSATAGNGAYSKESGEVAGDICPAGWSLPVGSSNSTSGSFYYLNQQMGGNTSAQGSNNWRSFPNNFAYSGEWYGSSAEGGRGSNGTYWSSTASNAGSAYYFAISTTNISPGTASHYAYGRYWGYSVRCLALAQ